MFIDVGSFEPLRGDEPWVGYRQFCMLFLYPLMLTAYRGVAFQPWLRGSLEGIEPADAAALLPRRRGVTVNARLLARLERRHGETSARETTSAARKAGFKPEIIRANVRRLRKLVRAPRVGRAGTTAWTRGYAEADLGPRTTFVGRSPSRVTPRLAWDLGANDGRVLADRGLARRTGGRDGRRPRDGRAALRRCGRASGSCRWSWTSATRRPRAAGR